MTMRLCRRCYESDSIRHTYLCKGCRQHLCRHLIFLKHLLCWSCLRGEEVQVDGQR